MGDGVNKGTGWGLVSELHFLDGLGTWGVMRRPLAVLLDGYERGLARRAVGFTEFELEFLRQRVHEIRTAKLGGLVAARRLHALNS